MGAQLQKYGNIIQICFCCTFPNQRSPPTGVKDGYQELLPRRFPTVHIATVHSETRPWQGAGSCAVWQFTAHFRGPHSSSMSRLYEP